MRVFQEVVCWDYGDANDHLIMIIIGVIALSLPLSFFAMCVHVARVFPSRMRAADTTFLENLFVYVKSLSPRGVLVQLSYHDSKLGFVLGANCAKLGSADIYPSGHTVAFLDLQCTL